MAATDNDESVDPAAVRRHRVLFRAIEKRRHPKLRRSDITVTDEGGAVKRATKAAALGNAMEWYDFGIYSYLPPPREGLLPLGKRHGPAAELLRYVRRRVPGASRGRHGLRPAGRQGRPQAHPVPHHDHDGGGGDLRHRRHPLARHDRPVGPPGPADLLPAGAGLLDRRGGVRGGRLDLHRGVRTRQAARLLRQLPGVRHARRIRRGGLRTGGPPQQRPRRGPDAALGLAHPLPGRGPRSASSACTCG